MGIDDVNFVYVQGGEPRLLVYRTHRLASDFFGLWSFSFWICFDRNTPYVGPVAMHRQNLRNTDLILRGHDH